jgi:hypothetical protein
MKFALDSIANLYLNIVTLESRGNRNQDFHELSIESLREVLSAAYYAGYSAAVRAQRGAESEVLPTEVHTVLAERWLHTGAAEPADGPDAETFVTAPIPEIALLRNPWREDEAADLLIPLALI